MVKTRVVFDSVDSVTGLNQSCAFNGFRQIEDVCGNGQGFVRYNVKQKAGLPQGTQFIQHNSNKTSPIK